MRFVHCADVHLDSPMRGLEAYEAAPVGELKGATRRAFENTVNLCCSEGAAFLVIAGDLFDGNWRDFNTGLFFVKQMARLRDAGVKVFLVRGNHDAQSRITKRLPLPDNVVEFPAAAPATKRLDDLGVAVHGCSFARPDTSDNLAARYPPPVPGYLNIGVLHTALNGREGHEPYAPCTRDELIARGYDYWALGHVHQREVVCEQPPIVFPGNLQARHIREAGAKGCTLVTVEDGRVTALEHRVVDVARWVLISVDAGTADTPDEVLTLVRDALRAEAVAAEGRLVAVRVRVQGRSPAHDALMRQEGQWVQDVRATAADVGFETIWVEKVELATRSPRLDDARRRPDDALAQLLQVADALRADPEAAAALLQPQWKDLVSRLPPEAQHGDAAIKPEEPQHLDRLIERAVDVIAGRLMPPAD
ncbi:MAG: DNA repair exonuclease [Rhodospirillales bacterium]|nr:DNA repair exonuclease [Rhodospirillales bacterium]